MWSSTVVGTTLGVLIILFVWWAIKSNRVSEESRRWADNAFDDEREFIENYRGPFWQIVESVPGRYLVQHASFNSSPMASEWKPDAPRWEPKVVWTTQTSHTSRREAEREVAERTKPTQDYIVVARYDHHGRAMA